MKGNKRAHLFIYLFLCLYESNKRAQQLHLDPVTTKLTCENYKQRVHQVAANL